MSAIRGAGSERSDMYEVFRDEQVSIVSDRPVARAEAKALAARIEKAWRNDLRQHKWDDQPSPRESLTVAVLSPRAFADFTGDATGAIAGVTTGQDTIVLPERMLRAATPEALNTLAHELAHVQDFREAGDAMTSIPTYLEEGKATVLGDAYGNDPQHLAEIGRTMASLSGDDASFLLRNFRHPSAERRPPQFVFLGEVTGALFVEYLSTHVKRDAVVRIADAVEASGNGTRFTDAFHQAFGLSLTQAERRFVAFMHDTERQPSRRLEGTLYEPR